MSEEPNGIVNGQEHMKISLQQMPKVLELYLEITPRMLRSAGLASGPTIKSGPLST